MTLFETNLPKTKIPWYLGIDDSLTVFYSGACHPDKVKALPDDLFEPIKKD